MSKILIHTCPSCFKCNVIVSEDSMYVYIRCSDCNFRSVNKISSKDYAIEKWNSSIGSARKNELLKIERCPFCGSNRCDIEYEWHETIAHIYILH